MESLINNLFEEEEEVVFPNGLGLAKVEKKLGESTMVIMMLKHWRDLDINQDYNFEIVIVNKLTDTATFFANYDLETLRKQTIGEYLQQVRLNENLISKVKEFIQYGK